MKQDELAPNRLPLMQVCAKQFIHFGSKCLASLSMSMQYLHPALPSPFFSIVRNESLLSDYVAMLVPTKVRWLCIQREFPANITTNRCSLVSQTLPVQVLE